MPFQLFECRRWQELSALVLHPDVFTLLVGTESGRSDLVVYWEALLDPDRGGISLTDRCDESMRMAKDAAFTPPDQISHLIRLSELLGRMSFPDIAVTFLRRAQALEDSFLGLAPLARVEYMLREARIIAGKGDAVGGARMFRRALDELYKMVDEDGDGKISFEELKASEAGCVLLDTEEELMQLAWESRNLAELETHCLMMLQREEDRPTNELLLLDTLLGYYIETGKVETARELLERALAAAPQKSLEEAHILSRLLCLLARVGRFFDAAKVVESRAHVARVLLGDDYLPPPGQPPEQHPARESYKREVRAPWQFTPPSSEAAWHAIERGSSRCRLQSRAWFPTRSSTRWCSTAWRWCRSGAAAKPSRCSMARSQTAAPRKTTSCLTRHRSAALPCARAQPPRSRVRRMPPRSRVREMRLLSRARETLLRSPLRLRGPVWGSLRCRRRQRLPRPGLCRSEQGAEG